VNHPHPSWSHLDKTHLAWTCCVGDIIFLDSYDLREQYGLPGRIEVLANKDDKTLVKNIMAGSINPDMECWIPEDTLVRQVFSPIEKRNQSAEWNF